ncbi:MAG: hypothetical protein LC099_07495 [Anaerolineales bacterium]|nr:hypothetical protein [Anaerolineales bacterium]
MQSNLILSEKRKFGWLYGLSAGVALALALWGKDAFLLWQARAVLAWVRFLIGGLVSVAAFGGAGWLTMRYENVFLTISAWLTAAFASACLAVWMPFDGWRFLLSIFAPALAGRFTPPTENSMLLVGVAALFFGIGAALAGILEYPLLEQAAFSSASGRMTAPLLVAAIVFLVVGSLADGAFHAKTRDSILSLDRAIQFAADHDLSTVDKATARAMRVSALTAAGDLVKSPRRLMIASLDLPTEQVQIWANFGDDWLLCDAVAAQVVNCRLVP